MNSLALQLDDESTTARATELADKYREKSKIVETGLVNLMKFIELPDDKDKKFDLKAYEECDKWQEVSGAGRQEAEEKAKKKVKENLREDIKVHIECGIRTHSLDVESQMKDSEKCLNLARTCSGDMRTLKVSDGRNLVIAFVDNLQSARNMVYQILGMCENSRNKMRQLDDVTFTSWAEGEIRKYEEMMKAVVSEIKNADNEMRTIVEVAVKENK